MHLGFRYIINPDPHARALWRRAGMLGQCCAAIAHSAGSAAAHVNVQTGLSHILHVSVSLRIQHTMADAARQALTLV